MILFHPRLLLGQVWASSKKSQSFPSILREAQFLFVVQSALSTYEKSIIEVNLGSIGAINGAFDKRPTSRLPWSLKCSVKSPIQLRHCRRSNIPALKNSYSHLPKFITVVVLTHRRWFQGVLDCLSIHESYRGD